MSKGKVKIVNNLDYYNYLKDSGYILFEAIVGSHAYGINTEASDVDKKFVFIEPLDKVLDGSMVDQLNIMGDDYVGYEVGRYTELLQSGNPNLLDLLNIPEDCILINTPIFQKYFIDNKKLFLTKKCAETFGSYAASQIQKARGTNKKIVNPFPKERKGLIDFCWVSKGQGSEPILEFLKRKKVKHIKDSCGVVAIDHMKNCYHLFYDENYDSFCETIEKDLTAIEDIFCSNPGYRGIVDKDNVQIVLSSVAKGLKPLCTFYCNIEGFQTYCKEYKEWWEWVEKRNEARYLKNIENGAQYDTKNLAHCIRLLEMCIEILKDGELNVRRKNRTELLAIRNGEYSYDELIARAVLMKVQIEELRKVSTLPDSFSNVEAQKLLLNLRKEVYEL